MLVLAVSLAGQQPRSDSGPPGMMGPGMHGMMMGMGPEMGAAMRVLVFAPDHLLARKGSLGLSPQQVTRLTALRDAAQSTHTAALGEARTHLQAVEQQSNATPLDSAALRVHFQAAHAAMGQAHWAMLSAAVQGRALLTETQRAKVHAWADSVHAWTERHRTTMHPHPPPPPH